MTKVKICGITDVETAKFACRYGADALGFVFAESKRRIQIDQGQEIISQLPRSVWKIGVFVNEQIETVRFIAAECGLDYVQLHGDESNAYIRALDLPVIKAVEASADLPHTYEADYLLVDSPKGSIYRGGNGIPFDWRLLNELDSSLRQKLILAGGLNEHNVQRAISVVRPYMVDASSGLETDGKKDLNKITRFIANVKGC